MNKRMKMDLKKGDEEVRKRRVRKIEARTLLERVKVR